MPERRALVVGIDQYDNFPPLSCACHDAEAFADLIGRNDDGSINYGVRLVTSGEGRPRLTRACLRQLWMDLFGDFTGDIVFYFSGHGAQTIWGAYLVTQDGSPDELGVSMEDLLLLANKSRARDVILILDCCHAGDLGNPPILQGLQEPLSLLREGVTILASSRPNEPSCEVNGHGMFTFALLEGLSGGAADLMGTVNAASLFLYAERVFDAWNQRPVYKSHTGSVSALRHCEPPIAPDDLRSLPKFFRKPDAHFRLDPQYESAPELDEDNPEREEKRQDCRLFKRLRDARLIESVEGDDLYWTAMNSKEIRLTGLGRYYWRLLDMGRI